MVLAFLREHQSQIVADLGEFGQRESPSTDKALLDDFSQFLAAYAARCGGRSEVLAMQDTGTHVRIRWGPDEGEPILLVGHFDTVWPEGTLQRMPFRTTDGVATGPGVFDMKAGLVHGFWAIRALREVAGVDRPIEFFCNGDEEVGSPTSQPLIETAARGKRAVFILEPSYDGALKTARKGVGIFHAEIKGRPAHAGLDPFAGASAIEELAHLISALHALSNRETGTTVNVGIVSGGTRSNVVAEQASADIDLRVTTQVEAERMTQVILQQHAHHPDVQVKMTGGINRPPMERTARTEELFHQARRLARELGIDDLQEAMVGGASDGNFCAILGIPVLDGLGAVGGGAHAVTEHVNVADMPVRAALVARLLETA